MKLMVLDGNSILNRSYYGIRPLTTKDGFYTQAIYGFLVTMARLEDEERPDAVCVTFDRREPTFRHLEYEGYKAQRKGMPEELAMQLPVMKEVLDAMNIPRYELAGYEADDLIGQGIESPRHDRSVAPDIELKHPQFAGFSADAADTA